MFESRGLGLAVKIMAHSRQYVVSILCFVSMLCLACLAVPCLSGQTVVVKGVVRDSSGAVIVGVTVHVQKATWEASTMTDGSGRFLLSDVPQGIGRIDITAQGFMPEHKFFGSDETPVVELEITLQPSQVSEQVVVSATRSQARLAERPGSE